MINRKVPLSTVLKLFKQHFPKVDQDCDNRINSGGCGIFAAKIYSTLKRYGHKPEIVLIHNHRGLNPKNVNSFNPDIHSWSWQHIMIKIKDKFIDSEGVYTNLKQTDWGHYDATSGLELKTLKHWIKDKQWNWMFSRHSYVPKINKCFTRLNNQLKLKINRRLN